MQTVEMGSRCLTSETSLGQPDCCTVPGFARLGRTKRVRTTLKAKARLFKNRALCHASTRAALPQGRVKEYRDGPAVAHPSCHRWPPPCAEQDWAYRPGGPPQPPHLASFFPLPKSCTMSARGFNPFKSPSCFGCRVYLRRRPGGCLWA